MQCVEDECGPDRGYGQCAAPCPPNSAFYGNADGGVSCVCFPGYTGTLCEQTVPFPWVYSLVMDANSAHSCDEFGSSAGSCCAQLYVASPCPQFPAQYLYTSMWTAGACPAQFSKLVNDTTYCVAGPASLLLFE